MAAINKTRGIEGKHSSVNRSVLRNLLLSMLAFGLFVGILFPPFAWLALKTDRAFSLVFIFMCVGAGLLVGAFNFLIFRRTVSHELNLIQRGMLHVHENIVDAEVLDDNCLSECTLAITSADIIGDISISFNNMTDEIFKRLTLEGESRALNTNLSTSVEVKDVSTTILNSLAAVMNAKAGLLYNNKEENLQLLSHFGVDQTEGISNLITARFGLIEKAINSNEILSCSKKDGWEWISMSTPLGGYTRGSIVLIPLVAKQRPVGIAILACSSESPSHQQVKTLQSLSTASAPYLDNSILHEKITELAAIDDLTNILNRGFGLRRLREEFSRAARHGIPISTIMVDIDNFKIFNDTFGHNAGDAVLRMVASKIQESLRAEDMVCRYGGEEFLVSLTGAGMNDSAVFTERIRRVVETNFVQWGDQQLSVTISCGVATYPIVRASVCEELITVADAALYAAKEFGRNQVTVHDGKLILRFSELKIGESKKE